MPLHDRNKAAAEQLESLGNLKRLLSNYRILQVKQGFDSEGRLGFYEVALDTKTFIFRDDVSAKRAWDLINEEIIKRRGANRSD